MERKELQNRITAAIGELMQIRLALNGQDFGLPEFAKQRLKERTCLWCRNPIRSDQRVLRGCHEQCKKRALDLIAEGIYTEYEAILEGKLAPANNGGHPTKEFQKLPPLDDVSLEVDADESIPDKPPRTADVGRKRKPAPQPAVQPQAKKGKATG